MHIENSRVDAPLNGAHVRKDIRRVPVRLCFRVRHGVWRIRLHKGKWHERYSEFDPCPCVPCGRAVD